LVIAPLFDDESSSGADACQDKALRHLLGLNYSTVPVVSADDLGTANELHHEGVGAGNANHPSDVSLT
jgi:hypothetical protein